MDAARVSSRRSSAPAGRDEAALEVRRILSQNLPPTRIAAQTASWGDSEQHTANVPAPPILTRSASDEAEHVRAASGSLQAMRSSGENGTAEVARRVMRRWHSEPRLDELHAEHLCRRGDGSNEEERGREGSWRGKVRFGDDQIREISPCSPELQPKFKTGLTWKRSDPGRCPVQWSQQKQRLYARKSFSSASSQSGASSGAGMATSSLKMSHSEPSLDEGATPVEQFRSWIENGFEDLNEHPGAVDEHAGAVSSKSLMSFQSPLSSLPPPLHIVSNITSGVSGIAKFGSLSLKSLTSKVTSRTRPEDKWKKFGEQRQRAY
jgi:hypothetical protein